MRCFTTELAEKVGLAKDRFPKTAQENALVEEALADELGNLSLDDHEKVLFDVHGIAKLEDEDPESQDDLEHYFQALDDELRKNISDKSAYEHAMYLNEAYVKSKAFRLAFLRGQRFNAKAAAQAIIFHFHHKREIFGCGDVLGRDIFLTDLQEDDLDCLNAGCLQVLPNRDGAGRAVIFLAPGYKRLTSVDSLLRAHWYMLSCVLRDEETQKKGFVFVVYNVGKYGAAEEWTFMRRMDVIQEGLPHKTVACHFCFNHAESRPYINGMQLFLEHDVRHRIRCHFYPSAKEIDFHLQTYGIPTQDFPINETETLVLDWHREWLDAQRALEESTIQSARNNNPDEQDTQESLNSDTVNILPRRFDVLFGRGRYTRQHTGNLRAAHLVEMYQTQYENASKFEKTEIAERIVAIIHESHGRFLKDNGKGGWEQVDFDTARAKVSHFFRHLRKNAKTTTSTATDSGSANNRRSSTSSASSEMTTTTAAASNSDSEDSRSSGARIRSRAAPTKTKKSTLPSKPNKRVASEKEASIDSSTPTDNANARHLANTTPLAATQVYAC